MNKRDKWLAELVEGDVVKIRLMSMEGCKGTSYGQVVEVTPKNVFVLPQNSVLDPWKFERSSGRTLQASMWWDEIHPPTARDKDNFVVHARVAKIRDLVCRDRFVRWALKNPDQAYVIESLLVASIELKGNKR